MLAYVFWHSATVDTSSYEYRQRLQAFHQRLNENPPTGLLLSHTWQIGSVPWLEGDAVHEDWYVLADAASLDGLAEAAVSHRLRSFHDSVAELATSGIAGLYKPARCERATVSGDTAAWFSRPAGTSYDELYRRLDQQNPSAVGRLWQRFLTLGPTPEFCLVGGERADLPVECEPLVVSRHS